jgi:hypothetical protein
MTPSRELDALVAEKVMGCADCRKVAYGDEGLGIAWDWECRLPGESSFSLLPEYSSDIADAWSVIEKLDSKYCEIAKIGGEWKADFGSDGIAWSEESASHAICLAALMSVGVEVPEKCEHCGPQKKDAEAGK